MTAPLRPMRWWDVEQVVELERSLFPHDAWTAEQLWSELAHVPETRWYLVHEDGEGIDGYAGLMSVPPDADVQTIAVAPRSQGRGIGALLLDSLLAQARARGCSQVFLEVLEGNLPALRLYERAGFRREGRRRDYYGPGLDAAVLRLRFRDLDEVPR